jgi:hypothetical protein
MTTKQNNETDIILQNLKDSFDLRECKCDVDKEEHEIIFCSVKCLHRVFTDGYPQGSPGGLPSYIYPGSEINPVIKWATVDELNTLPNGVEEVTVYVLERNDCKTISDCVTSVPEGYTLRGVPEGYKLSTQYVNNLPTSLESLAIHVSEVPREDFRMPYGSKLFIREEHTNHIYDNQYDVMCQLFDYRRKYIQRLRDNNIPKLKTINWSATMKALDDLD